MIIAISISMISIFSDAVQTKHMYSTVNASSHLLLYHPSSHKQLRFKLRTSTWEIRLLHRQKSETKLTTAIVCGSKPVHHQAFFILALHCSKSK